LGGLINCTMTAAQSSSQTTVTIRGYYEEPKSISNSNTIVIKGVSKGEFIEVVIEGVIREFQLVRLGWDDKSNNIVEKEIIHEINEVQDQTVVIKTYMPEGIPFEKIKWKSITGKDYEFTICEEFSPDFPGFWKFVCK